jgi:hypothetical protein
MNLAGSAGQSYCQTQPQARQQGMKDHHLSQFINASQIKSLHVFQEGLIWVQKGRQIVIKEYQ